MMAIILRPATGADIPAVAQLWHDAWHDAHDGLVPPAWSGLRTLANFRDRTPPLIPHMTIAEDPSADGRVAGFCTIAEDTLKDLFVTRDHRGRGIADALLLDGEARLSRQGTVTASMNCAVGNDRAQRFYEKKGWHIVGRHSQSAESNDGRMELPVWRMAKDLAPPSPAGEM